MARKSNSNSFNVEEFGTTDFTLDMQVEELYVEKELPKNHNDIGGRDAEDSHPIEAITGLREELDNKVEVSSDIATASAGEIAIFSEDGKLECCGHTISDIAMKSDLENLPAAQGGSDKHYTYLQPSASDRWLVEHNLNKFPSVQVVDSAGSIVVGEITYIDRNSLEIKFSGKFSGRAYLN